MNLELPVFSSPVNILNHVKTIAIFEKAINEDVPDFISDPKYLDRHFLSLFRVLFVPIQYFGNVNFHVRPEILHKNQPASLLRYSRTIQALDINNYSFICLMINLPLSVSFINCFFIRKIVFVSYKNS